MLSLEKQKKNWRSWCFIVHGLKYQALPTLHDESNTWLIKCLDTCFFIRNFIFCFSLKLLWKNHNFSLKAVKTGGKRVHVYVSFREQNHMFGFYNNKIFAFFILFTNRVKLCRRKCLHLCVALSKSYWENSSYTSQNTIFQFWKSYPETCWEVAYFLAQILASTLSNLVNYKKKQVV